MKHALLLLLLIVFASIYAVSAAYDAPSMQFERSDAHTSITLSGERTVYPDAPGQPAIPVLSFWRELPRGEQLVSVSVTPIEVSETTLDAPPTPLQQPTPLHMIDQAEFVDATYRGVTPAAWLRDSGSGQLGDHTLAWVTVNAAQWNAGSNTLLAPQHFEIEWHTAPSSARISREETVATAAMLRSLDMTPRTPRLAAGYLIIAPADWLDTCVPLLEWRRRQGMRVFYESLEGIESAYNGEDTQAKLRACIDDYYMQEMVSFVTLAADSDFIPDRTLFAFDCEFGAYENENELHGDLYYSGLDGDWDADGDGIYGEDEDDPDWFPEVNVGRIPAMSEADLTAYIARLLDYEHGAFEDYTRALGFSMELWPGSHSYMAQQFLYDNYFGGWDVNFLYGDANSFSNVMAGFAENPNVIQHTGHALYHVLALEGLNIYLDDMNDLPCDWGGVMYSIGCWSAALDYESIGETAVCPDGNGMVAYVGNSRYGWGAPGAAAFGFSEFFQREFFRQLLLENSHEVSLLNNLQKLPFTPYYHGTSVYKWCGYELNALGDAATRIFTANPLPLSAELSVRNDTLSVQVHSEGEVIEGAVVTIGDAQATTDATGLVVIANASSLSGAVTVYAPDYTLWSEDDFAVEHYLLPSFGDISSLPSDYRISQNKTATITASLHNATDEQISYTVQMETDSMMVVLTAPVSGEIAAGETIALTPMQATLLSVDEIGQLAMDDTVIAWLAAYDDMNNLICRTPVTFYIRAPELAIHAMQVTWNGDDSQLLLTVANHGDRPAASVAGAFTSNSEWVTAPIPFTLEDPLAAGETAQVICPISYSPGAPEDHIASLNLMFYCVDNLQNYEFESPFLLPLRSPDYQVDFDSGLSWSGDDAWECVDTYAMSGSYSLSCRPESPSVNDLATPWFRYAPGATIAFDYRYKMPMYGADGVYIMAEWGGETDTLLFLGSGGALPPGGRDPEVYIESGWAHYQVNLDEALTNTPDTDETVRIVWRFNVDEIIADFNDYATMPEVGVFIDDFVWTIDGIASSEEDDIPTSPTLTVWPNPLESGQTMRLAFSMPVSGNAEVVVYNLRGQKVRTLSNEVVTAGSHSAAWDLRNDNGQQVATGVYLVRLRAGSHEVTRKALLLR